MQVRCIPTRKELIDAYISVIHNASVGRERGITALLASSIHDLHVVTVSGCHIETKLAGPVCVLGPGHRTISFEDTFGELA